MYHNSRVRQAVMNSVYNYSQIAAKLRIPMGVLSETLRHNITPAMYEKFLEAVKRWSRITDPKLSDDEMLIEASEHFTATKFARDTGFPVLFTREIVYSERYTREEFKQLWRDIATLTGQSYEYLIGDTYDCRKGAF